MPLEKFRKIGLMDYNKEDVEMTVWESEVRKTMRINFWLGFLFGMPIWTIITIISIMIIATVLGYDTP